MINLEELSLYLAIVLFDSADYLNGVQLRDKILQYLPRMKKCHFDIDTTTIKRNSDLLLPSNDDIQRSFIGEPFRSVRSHVDVFGKANGTGTHAYSLPHQFYSRCHVFSLPYRFPDLAYLSNSFQSGTFERVHIVRLADVRPFEHDFFRIISQSFPSLKTLYIFNDMPQASQQTTRTPINFPRLRRLGLCLCRVDYATQFLVDEHCQLPRLHELRISWTSLMSVTNDFTNAATRLTCSRLKSLCIRKPFVRPGHFHDYFSSL